MVQPLWVLSELMATGCAIWLGMCGSGPVVVTGQIVVMAITLCVAVPGPAKAPIVVSRSGSGTAQALTTATLDFGCVVELAWR
jgi:hypothetical protein